MARAGVTRRHFLKTLSSGVLSLPLAGTLPLIWSQVSLGKTSSEPAELLLICHTMDDFNPSADYYERSSTGELRIWSQGWSQAKAVSLPFLGHSVLPHPRNSRLAYVVEKWGPYAALVDIGALSVVRLLKLPEGQTFMGHGSFDSEGRRFFVAAHDHVVGKGILVVLEPKTFDITGRLDSGGTYPHECKLSLDKNDLWVMNSNRARHFGETDQGSTLCRFDLRSEKIVETIQFDTYGSAGFGHFGLAEDGFIVAGGSPGKSRGPRDSCPVVVLDPKRRITRLEVPRECQPFFTREALNFVFDTKKPLVAVLGTAVDHGSSVIVWDYHEKKHEKSIRLSRDIAMLRTREGIVVSDSRTMRYELIVPFESGRGLVRSFGISGRGGVHMARTFS